METLPEIELLQYIHKTADMGCQGIESVLERIDPSQGLQSTLKHQHSEYEHLRARAAELIARRNEEAPTVGAMMKRSADWMAAAKLAMDASPSKVAEMTIQGTTMGVTKTIKHLKDYRGNDPETRELAQRLLETQEANVEQMKSYL